MTFTLSHPPPPPNPFNSAEILSNIFVSYCTDTIKWFQYNDKHLRSRRIHFQVLRFTIVLLEGSCSVSPQYWF